MEHPTYFETYPFSPTDQSVYGQKYHELCLLSHLEANHASQVYVQERSGQCELPHRDESIQSVPNETLPEMSQKNQNSKGQKRQGKSREIAIKELESETILNFTSQLLDLERKWIMKEKSLCEYLQKQEKTLHRRETEIESYQKQNRILKRSLKQLQRDKSTLIEMVNEIRKQLKQYQQRLIFDKKTDYLCKKMASMLKCVVSQENKQKDKNHELQKERERENRYTASTEDNSTFGQNVKTNHQNFQRSYVDPQTLIKCNGTSAITLNGCLVESKRDFQSVSNKELDRQQNAFMRIQEGNQQQNRVPVQREKQEKYLSKHSLESADYSLSSSFLSDESSFTNLQQFYPQKSIFEGKLILQETNRLFGTEKKETKLENDNHFASNYSTSKKILNAENQNPETRCHSANEDNLSSFIQSGTDLFETSDENLQFRQKAQQVDKTKFQNVLLKEYNKVLDGKAEGKVAQTKGKFKEHNQFLLKKIKNNRLFF